MNGARQPGSRPVDELRAARMVAAALSRSNDVFRAAYQEMVSDPWRDGELDPTLNVVRELVSNVAHALRNEFGSEAEAIIQALVASLTHESESESEPGG
ncbi:hypothetical protein GCM10017586_14420 [Microbacterium imperiale]|uniref:Uncharacterized protein n=1 Tax=Microbacterium imperiale TaxID=33884 RepID=A0A9W6HFP1_9MICO|nr:hypothetical protein GCM10017544_03290 [Microbacterium imperiale]GLJ79760.1 hypothetical protein GCM10017586_14420 [Microbacterium imperiale]